MPGEYFDFAGYTAPTTGARGAAGNRHTADNAICEEVTINWNWSTCELLTWSLRFAAGEPLGLTHDTGVIVDAVIPDPAIVCGTKVTLTSSRTVWPNIVSASLTIRAANKPFVNSSTQCFTGRRPGPIDWNASVVEQATTLNPTLSPATCLGTIVGGSTILSLWVDATTYWDLHWGQLMDASDLNVDIDTGDIIGMTNNFAMNGFFDGDEGRIARPGEDGGSNPYWWPDEVIAATLPF